MIRFTRIEVENFVCFATLLLEPSIDPERPLTVVRAENASGKTTLLRAVRWGMYGERALPAERSAYRIHPTWWEPTDDGVDTTVAIEFSTDGSTRHDSIAGDRDTRYRLTRTVRTVARDNAVGHQRIDEVAHLMYQEVDGAWHSHTLGIDHIVGQLLPWDLRDFFVMDADEAAEYAGGSESETTNRREVEQRTSFAVNALLGIDVFRRASTRVAEARRSFGAKATKAIGDADLNEMQTQREELANEIHDVKEQREAGDRQLIDLRDRLSKQKDKLDQELMDVGALDEVRKRRDTNVASRKHAKLTHENVLTAIEGSLRDPTLYSLAAEPHIRAAMEVLRPLYERGQIPMPHLGFVRQLLVEGRCVCGEELVQGGSHRTHVEDQLRASEVDEAKSDFLWQVFSAGRELERLAAEPGWASDLEASESRLAQADQLLSELDADAMDIDELLRAADRTKIPSLQEELGALEVQIERITVGNLEYDNRLGKLQSEEDALNKRIHARQSGEVAAKGHRDAEDLAEVISEILTSAYQAVEEKQVATLSNSMDRLFNAMVDNVTEEDADIRQAGKETIRTIAQVGVRRLPGTGFEIFAINNHGRDKPHNEINGASRRVIALAFVLALCHESNTRAPLLADSLLNMMSGAVRRNTLATIAQKSGQPILLLTGADLEADTEIETVDRYAGATYTLTAQWHGEVVNQTDPRAVCVACECGPRQYCGVCERVGQAGRPAWTKRA